jgi:hypothetical protein
MQNKPQCPKGHGSMTRGFDIDHKGNFLTVASWLPGEPEANIFFPVRLKGRKPIPTVTWRCNQCGLLERYAVE